MLVILGETLQRKGIFLSYREHLKAQKKYIEAKKEARRLQKNPPPKRLDPPPPESFRHFGQAAFVLVLILAGALLYIFLRPLPAATKPEHFRLGLHCSESEFEQLKNWLEPEILANNLPWKLFHLAGHQNLIENLLSDTPADLLFLEAETADSFAAQKILVPIREGEIFRPLWEPQPFLKTLGWAVPYGENAAQARHFLTVIRQFARPFSLSCAPPIQR